MTMTHWEALGIAFDLLKHNSPVTLMDAIVDPAYFTCTIGAYAGAEDLRDGRTFEDRLLVTKTLAGMMEAADVRLMANSLNPETDPRAGGFLASLAAHARRMKEKYMDREREEALAWELTQYTAENRMHWRLTLDIRQI